MSQEWITDRRPTQEDCAGVDRVPHSDHVWVMYEGKVTTCPFGDVVLGCPWRPIVIDKPEPYVKPKRWRVTTATGGYLIYDSITSSEVADSIPTSEAAERIAAIYEEVMP